MDILCVAHPIKMSVNYPADLVCVHRIVVSLFQTANFHKGDIIFIPLHSGFSQV